MKIQEKGQEKSKQIQNKSRRKAVKTIASGVSALAAYHVLPVNWSKPVIEQIFLPAHAAVSGVSLNDPCTVELVSGNQSTSTIVVRVNGLVTPPVGGLATTIVATANGGSGGPVIANTTTAADGTFSAEITMTGGPGILGVGVSTTIAGAGGSASCSVGLVATTTTRSPDTPPNETTPAPTTTTAPTTTPAPTGVQLTLGRALVRASVFPGFDWDFVYAVTTVPTTPPTNRTFRAILYRENGSILRDISYYYTTNPNWVFNLLNTEVNPGETLRIELSPNNINDTVTGSPQTATVPAP